MNQHPTASGMIDTRPYGHSLPGRHEKRVSDFVAWYAERLHSLREAS